MKGRQRQNREQLDLPLMDERADEKRQLDRKICKEITKLLELLLDECACNPKAKTKGAHDEQDQR
jgi:hypothetical protein